MSNYFLIHLYPFSCALEPEQGKQ